MGKKGKILKIDKRLPQIIVPENKIQMFIDWWNSDIRFEKYIPQTFNEGYIKINNIETDLNDMVKYTDLIKYLARELHTTYRVVEKQFIEFFNISKSITMYFKFTSDSSMFIETYDINNIIMSNMEFAVGIESDAEKPIDLSNMGYVKSFDDLTEKVNYINLAILVTCLWYIATTKRSTKYIYEQKTPVITSRNKGVVQVSDTKFISTPIYDISKIRVVKVDTLSARKKGWTYSHSFEVHGHYRHYKDGRVIFIKPYIKGKNKEFKAQKIIITPESEEMNATTYNNEIGKK